MNHVVSCAADVASSVPGDGACATGCTGCCTRVDDAADTSAQASDAPDDNHCVA